MLLTDIVKMKDGAFMKCYMYILECVDRSLYVGSTKYLDFRLKEHQIGEGANHTRKRLPVKLVYFEEFKRIDYAFNREKQVQKWTRAKKIALINGDVDKLKHEAECKNGSHFRNYTGGFGSAQPPDICSLNENELNENCNDKPLDDTDKSDSDGI